MANKTEYAKGIYGYDVPGSGVSVTIRSGKNNNTPQIYQPSVTNTVSAEKKAETAIAELRNQYAKQLRAEYEHSAEKMKNERDDALRENWILEQQEEAGLSEKLASEGINGGAAETTLSGLRSRYQGNRNDIRKGYIEELGDLSFNHQKQQAEAARSYDEKWLDYLISLAENEDQFLKSMAVFEYK